MPLVCLVRHGQASFGTADYDVLSDIGGQQARLTALALVARGVRDPLMVSGSLRRHRDTVTAMSDAAGWGAARIDERWNEYDELDFLRTHLSAGIAGDAPVDSRAFQQALDRELMSWIDAADRDGWTAFARRVRSALVDVVTGLTPGRDAVVTTSGGVVAAVCADLLGAPAAGFVALNRVTVNGGITTLLVGRTGVNLLSFNDHAHFAGERRAMLTYR